MLWGFTVVRGSLLRALGAGMGGGGRGFLEDVDLNWACVDGEVWLSSEGPPNMEVEVNTKSQGP